MPRPRLLSTGLLFAACSAPQAREQPAAEPLAPKAPVPEAAEAPELAPVAPEPRTSHGFRFEAQGPNFTLWSDGVERPYDRFSEICEETARRVRDWLDLPDPDSPIDFYLVSEAEHIRRLEEEVGLPDSVTRGLPAEYAEGGYYHPWRTLVLRIRPDMNVEWMVCHEACHPLFRELAGRNPAWLNEGLAETLPSWILFSETAGPEEAGFSYASYQQYLKRLVAANGLPTLAEFTTQSTREFHSDRWRGFSLAWSLVALLLTSDHPEVQGRVPELVRALASRSTLWEDVTSVYDAELLERLWHEFVRGL